MTLLTELKNKTATVARLLTSLLLLGIFVPSGSGGTNDGVNFRNTALLLRQPTIITFDAPGSGTGPGQGPNVYSIAPNGAAAGFYLDADNVVHGFVREADGGSGVSRPELRVRRIPARPTRP